MALRMQNILAPNFPNYDNLVGQVLSYLNTRNNNISSPPRLQQIAQQPHDEGGVPYYGTGRAQTARNVTMGQIDHDNPLDPMSELDPKTKAQLQLQYGKLNQTGNLGEQKLEMQGQNNQDKNQIAQQRANVYQFKAENPDMKIDYSPGGNIMLINPKNGEVHDTGVSSGVLSKQDEINLRTEGALQQIDARGKVQTALQTQRGQQQTSNIAQKGQIQKDLQSTRSVLPTQQRADIGNKFQQVMNTRPDLAKWITNNGDGTYSITAPSEGFFGHSGPTLDEYNQIKNSIYGVPTKSNTTITNKSEQPNVNDRVTVKDKNGKQFTVPSNQVDLAKQQGYTLVGGGSDNNDNDESEEE